MTQRSPMHQQIDTLPELIRNIVKPFDASARHAFVPAMDAARSFCWRTRIRL